MLINSSKLPLNLYRKKISYYSLQKFTFKKIYFTQIIYFLNISIKLLEIVPCFNISIHKSIFKISFLRFCEILRPDGPFSIKDKFCEICCKWLKIQQKLLKIFFFLWNKIRAIWNLKRNSIKYFVTVLIYAVKNGIYGFLYYSFKNTIIYNLLIKY